MNKSDDKIIEARNRNIRLPKYKNDFSRKYCYLNEKHKYYNNM